jgi:hypothetical protein
LDHLGVKPSLPKDQRNHLFKLCKMFQRSFQDGRRNFYGHLIDESLLEGANLNPCPDETDTKSLGASMTELNNRFAEYMRNFGHTYTIKPNPFRDPPVGGPYQGEDQITPEAIDKEEAIRQFQHVFNESRGRELIGTANPALIRKSLQGAVQTMDDGSD